MATDWELYKKQTEKLRNMKPLTDWDDINVGDKFHIPPINMGAIRYERRQVFVSEKDDKWLYGYFVCPSRVEVYQDKIHKNEISARFLVKIEKIF